jgi:hypothetical protein
MNRISLLKATAVAGSLIYGLENVVGVTTILIGQDITLEKQIWTFSDVSLDEVHILGHSLFYFLGLS